MIAAAVRTVIRSNVDDPDPAAALRRAAIGLNTGPTDTIGAQFTTCFHARISPDGMLRWVDAGHGLTVIRRADGTSEFLRSGHLPIGVGTSWTSDELSLRPGDSVISVSDGVLDLFGGSLDSIDRYRDFVSSRPDIDTVVSELVARAAGSEQEDDATVIAVTWGTA